jgi:hypothetical protein
MTRKLKTSGVALLAALALTAVAASIASAADYTASAYPTTGTGESPIGNGTFITEAGSTECKTHFEATLTEASSRLTVKTKVPECARAFGLINATVNMGSCDYLFTEPIKTAPNAWLAPVDIACTNSWEPMTVTAATCKVTIGSQTPGGGANITNTAGDVSVQITLEGIKYAVIQDGFGCPFNGTGQKTGATSVQHLPVTFASTNGAVIDVG